MTCLLLLIFRSRKPPALQKNQLLRRLKILPNWLGSKKIKLSVMLVLSYSKFGHFHIWYYYSYYKVSQKKLYWYFYHYKQWSSFFLGQLVLLVNIEILGKHFSIWNWYDKLKSLKVVVSKSCWAGYCGVRWNNTFGGFVFRLMDNGNGQMRF